MKLHYTNNDVNSIVYSFAVARSNDRPTAAFNILESLRDLWFKVTEGIVDVDDVNVVWHGLSTVLDEHAAWMMERKATVDEADLKADMLEAAATFNNLWKRYTRTCSLGATDISNRCMDKIVKNFYNNVITYLA